MQHWILIAVLAPFLAAVLGAIAPRRLAEVWGYPCAAAALAAALLLAQDVLAGNAPRLTILPIIEGVNLALRVDALGATFGVLATGLWLVASLYSSGYVRASELDHRPRYFACFSASIGAAVGVAYASNLLTFLLFYELLTLTTYPLVAHKQTPQAIAAARRYLAFALSGGVVLLIAIAWAWRATGTLDFTPGGFLKGHIDGPALVAMFALFLAGAGVKAAIMPFHSWLPAAMVAPSPVSALLHAVAVVKAGVFACIRMIGFVFGPDLLQGTTMAAILAVICGTTIIVGSLLAIRQNHLKRRLAYSTVVHLSFIVLGAILLAPTAMTGSILHLVNHGLCKITLFFCAGAIYATAHLEYIDDMKGLARRMPWTFGAFTIASLGLIGVPGLCGFVSKLFLLQGTLQANEIAYLVLLLVASLFSAAYLMPVVVTAMYRAPDPAKPGDHHHDPHHPPTGEARPTLVIPLLFTAALVIVFGLIPAAINVQYTLASMVAQQVFGGAP